MAGSRQNQYALYVPSTDDQFTTMELLRPLGRGEVTENFGTRTTVYVNGVDGTYQAFGQEEQPPGDSPTLPLTFFQESDLKLLEKFANQGKVFNCQVRLYDCASLDNPTGWDRIWQFSQCKIASRALGEGPTVRAGGAFVESTMGANALAMIDVVQLALTNLTNAETEDMLCIDGIGDLAAGCGAGYPGPDKVLVAGAQAVGGASANAYFSINGGSSWTVFTTDPNSTVTEDLGAALIFPLGTGFRVIFARITTDAAAPAEVFYGTSTAFDATTIAAMTWTAVNLGATNAEFVEKRALFRLGYTRLYAGTDGGDIYVSTTQGESWTQLLAGDAANDINCFASDKDGGVWAAGATNTIVYESPSNRGTFSAKTGPSGGGEFYSLAIGNDGTIFAGNGTSIFRNNNNAGTAGAWTSLKNFGTNKNVIKIWFEGQNKLQNGESQIIRCVVDNAAPGDGEVWQSVDWGQSWAQITNVTQDGYNDVYVSRYGNKAVIVGDDDPLSIIQLLS